MNQDKNQFHYVYSPKTHEEIKRIRDKYISIEEDKVSKIKMLDKGTTVLSTIVSLFLGICGTLIFGFGLTCCLLWSDKLLIVGILLGIVGILFIIIAYPVYIFITRKEQKKIAAEILSLIDEILK